MQFGVRDQQFAALEARQVFWLSFPMEKMRNCW